MRKAFLVLSLLIGLCCLPTSARTYSHPSYATRTPRASASLRSGFVRGYSRKNGTYVSPHLRKSPGTSIKSEGRGVGTNRIRHSSIYPQSGSTIRLPVARDSRGRIKRSSAARDAFKRQQTCPSTGRSAGACPGYIIDHVKPLECGGADDPSNIHWQTIADGRAKDKTERYCR